MQKERTRERQRQTDVDDKEHEMTDYGNAYQLLAGCECGKIRAIDLGSEIIIKLDSNKTEPPLMWVTMLILYKILLKERTTFKDVGEWFTNSSVVLTTSNQRLDKASENKNAFKQNFI